MAATGSMLARFVLQKPGIFLQKRWYAIKPPPRLGGKIRRKGKAKDHSESLSYNEKFAIYQNVDQVHVEEAPSNIGCDYLAGKVSLISRRNQKRVNKQNPELEYAARHRELNLDLEAVSNDWSEEYGPHHIRTLVDHYGIYRDLFNGAFFIPSLPMSVAYDYNEDLVAPVCFGNELLPAYTAKPPYVEYEAEPDSLWTLILTNPDGHLTDNSREYLHWFIGNIPGDDVGSGEVVCDYLQPFPPRGTGFHRFVFVLFRQSQRLDLSKYKLPEKCANLEERTFETVEFFREFQSNLTPMAVNFFQAEWDESVQDVFHRVLDMKEPGFEYRHPPPYHPPQQTYPKRQPFDRYFDRYRDKADISEEVVRKKLSVNSPFRENPKPHIYPFIHKDTKYKPTWLKRREEFEVRRLEQFKDLS